MVFVALSALQGRPMAQAFAELAVLGAGIQLGRHDSHQPIRPDTFGLGWARARLASAAHVVYESYLHKLSARSSTWCAVCDDSAAQ